MFVQIPECLSFSLISSFQDMRYQFSRFYPCVSLWHLWFLWIVLWMFPGSLHSFLCPHTWTMTCSVCLCQAIACLCFFFSRGTAIQSQCNCQGRKESRGTRHSDITQTTITEVQRAQERKAESLSHTNPRTHWMQLKTNLAGHNDKPDAFKGVFFALIMTARTVHKIFL